MNDKNKRYLWFILSILAGIIFVAFLGMSLHILDTSIDASLAIYIPVTAVAIFALQHSIRQFYAFSEN